MAERAYIEKHPRTMREPDSNQGVGTARPPMKVNLNRKLHELEYTATRVHFSLRGVHTPVSFLFVFPAALYDYTS